MCVILGIKRSAYYHWLKRPKSDRNKKDKATTNSNHNYQIAPNILNQDFTANYPNEKWVGDITYIWTDEGWLYLASIEDLFSKKVCGWAFNDRITKELTMLAFNQAHQKEKPTLGLIFHSDYTEEKTMPKFYCNHCCCL